MNNFKVQLPFEVRAAMRAVKEYSALMFGKQSECIPMTIEMGRQGRKVWVYIHMEREASWTLEFHDDSGDGKRYLWLEKVEVKWRPCDLYCGWMPLDSKYVGNGPTEKSELYWEIG
jgi:hypothetical protein